MRIKNITVKGFRRFDDLKIELGEQMPKVVAMVGPNGSGKSSVFDAFEEKLKLYKGASYNPKSDFFNKFAFSEEDAKKDLQYDRNSNIQIEREDSKAFGKISFYIRPPYRYAPSIMVTDIRGTSTDLIDDVNRPSTTTQLDRRLQENYEQLLANAYDLFEEGSMTGDQVREQLVGKINESLKNILGDLQISFLGNVRAKKGQLHFKKGKYKDIPYENLSSGEKEIVDIIIDLQAKLSIYNDTAYCIDEPELHLNSAIQRNLLNEIVRILPENNQLWVATHSIGFLRALQKDLKGNSIILDFSDKDFDESQVITPMKMTRENWKRIFSTALEDLTGLLSPEEIYYCEGRKDTSDEKGLDAICYRKIFEVTKPESLFVSSGGSTEPDDYSEIALKILQKAFDSVKIFILKDRDDENREEWINKDPDKRRMLKRREIENYLYDWTVISKLDPTAIKEEYEKVVKDIVNDNVKDSGGDIKKNVTPSLDSNNLEDYKKLLAEQISPDMDVYKELEEIIFKQ